MVVAPQQGRKKTEQVWNLLEYARGEAKAVIADPHYLFRFTWRNRRGSISWLIVIGEVNVVCAKHHRPSCPIGVVAVEAARHVDADDDGWVVLVVAQPLDGSLR